jgi:hypothetical protein
MRHSIATAFEILGLTLAPGVALGFLAWLVAELRPTLHAALAAVAALPLWAQLYLVLVLALVIGAPVVPLALGASRRQRDQEDLALPGLREGGR